MEEGDEKGERKDKRNRRLSLRQSGGITNGLNTCTLEEKITVTLKTCFESLKNIGKPHQENGGLLQKKKKLEENKTKTHYLCKDGFLKMCIPDKKIPDQQLQKANFVSEANFANKADSVSSQEDPIRNDVTKKKPENLNNSVNFSSEMLEKLETQNRPDDSPAQPVHSISLVQKKDAPEVLLHADPFEEVPGPDLLKKISSVWKFVPEIGCQATVSAMLSFFNITQKLSVKAKLADSKSRPFDGLFRKHGPVVRLQGPMGADTVIICKPEHVAKVYSQEGKHPVRATLDSVEKCRSKTRKGVGGPFNVNGIEWEEMRKALQEPLSRCGEKHFQALEQAADLFVKRVRSIRNRQNEVPEDFMTEVVKWGMECFCHVILGKTLGFQYSELNSSPEPSRLLKAVMEATENICKCESGFQLWRFMNTASFANLTQACEVIDGFLSKNIRLAQVNLTKNKDEILNKSQNGLPFIENLLLNECMAPEEVLTCLIDILLIGVNTTSSSLAFTLYHLAQNQRSQRTLLKELKEFLPEKRSSIQYEQLSSMKYLEACIKESLRLRLPMPTLTRVLPNDIVLSNFRIPKGTYMVMDIQAACLKEQNFEKCDKFLPERWLDSSTVQPYSFIPYGHGLRSCIGRQLAEVQLKTCLAKVIRNYQIEYNYGEIQGTKAVISFPDKPLKLTFLEREE